jgi:dihydropyrimidinase
MAMPRTIVKGGTVVSAKEVVAADVVIEAGKIVEAAPGAAVGPQDAVIDAAGLLVLPGIIDAHTHIQLDTGIYKTADNWSVGSRTAAAGGVTTVIDFATQFPGQTFDEAVDNRLAEAQPAIIDYALHCMITEFPVGAEASLQTLIDRGLPSLKIYTTYRPNYYMDDATLLRLMDESVRIGGLVIVHAENDAIVSESTGRLVQTGQTGWRFHAQARPALAEQEAVNRILFLAEAANAPVYIVHCTTGRSIEMVAAAAWKGRPAWCETCPQYLLLDDRVYAGDHPEHYILQPPIRPEGEPEKVWKMVESGAVSVISTDSCDYTIEQKQEFAEFTRTPGGLPGIETLLPLVYTYGVDAGRIELTDLCRMLAENPARLFGLAPRKGFLKPGSDADIVLYDPKPEKVVRHESQHYLSGYSPYEGMRIKGEVKLTISRGEVVYQNGQITGRAGRGQFVPGSPFEVSKLVS